MKFKTIGSSALLALSLFTPFSLQEDIFGNCRNRFQPHPAICDKFEFVSSEEAVQKGCVVLKNGTVFYDLSDLPEVNSIVSHDRKVASLITNVFEDGDANFAYAYCNNIHDLRGYTSGYAGFTTGTGDALTLIKEYSNNKPNNQLQQFVPRLEEIDHLPYCDRKSRGSVDGLQNYCRAWQEEACDASNDFAELQREWVYKNYMLPSARYAAEYGIDSPLGRAIFYDTIIQHGYQYVEPDINIVRILTLTGPRMSQESEQDYLTRFLTTRRELQCCYPDNVWPASASRSADLQYLVDNFVEYEDLRGDIPLKHFGRTINGKEEDARDRKHCH
ncbi:lysozyme-like domain-containing protein [Mycotypha africana]|uniref:lysozyme-like domain-containing protein n=1 Tax=Mycotypha africana TaxID=64632 RepID=UPI0023004D47|nr:lysozyme-like domain-containing protein [Mycotypha africana]KAI8984004.1 lysozyme-like domain-containing protein [Mycotypha africana]